MITDTPSITLGQTSPLSARQWGNDVAYQDLRDFIAEVEQARRAAARRRARTRTSSSAASPRWRPGCRMPGAAVRPHQGLRARLPRLHQRHREPAARRARARARPDAAAARRAQGLDGEAPDAHADAQAGHGQGRAGARKLRRAAARSTSASCRRPSGTRSDGGPYIGSGSIVIMRDPDGGWINASIYRVQVHGKTKVTIQFDHPGRHGAIIAKKYWDQGKPCPVAVVNGEDPALFIAGFEYLPAGASEYDFAGAIKGAPIEVFDGPVDRPAAAGARRDHPRRRAPADEPGDAAGRAVRRVHRLLRRRQAALPGDGGHGDPSPQRSDPARLAADEAAALPFRPAVPRRQHLEQSRDRRRHRRGRRVAARRAAHDRGGAQAALRRPRQARRPDRGRQQLHGAPRRRGRRRRRSRPTSPT